MVAPLAAPVLASAMNALVKDLVLDPLLNTLILSSMMTLPNSFKEQVFELRLEPDERAALDRSAAAVKELVEALK